MTELSISHPIELAPGIYGCCRWTLMERTWARPSRCGGRGNVLACSASGGTIRTITDHRCKRRADKEYLYFLWMEDVGDIWVM